jgi:hypothetical protein
MYSAGRVGSCFLIPSEYRLLETESFSQLVFFSSIYGRILGRWIREGKEGGEGSSKSTLNVTKKLGYGRLHIDRGIGVTEKRQVQSYSLGRYQSILRTSVLLPPLSLSSNPPEPPNTFFCSALKKEPIPLDLALARSSASRTAFSFSSIFLRRSCLSDVRIEALEAMAARRAARSSPFVLCSTLAPPDGRGARGGAGGGRGGGDTRDRFSCG